MKNIFLFSVLCLVCVFLRCSAFGAPLEVNTFSDYKTMVAFVTERAGESYHLTPEPATCTIYVISTHTSSETLFRSGRPVKYEVPICLICKGNKIRLKSLANQCELSQKGLTARVFREKRGLVAEFNESNMDTTQYPLKTGDLVVFTKPRAN